jgi:pimeloyl-ACP methyl ester carboxylesterase
MRFGLALLLALSILVGGGLPAAAAGPTPTERTMVLFAGGYGSTSLTATDHFAALRAALSARQAGLSFAQFSYRGWDAAGCTGLPYDAVDTAQDFDLSKQRLVAAVDALTGQCGAQRIVVIGHSLGGLVAFHALADQPRAAVVELVTADSPLGGAPATQLHACIEWGVCSDGPVETVLAALHGSWAQTGLDNAARVERLAAAGTRVTAWGNQSDCLYAASLCVPVARILLGRDDARATQWLGVPRAMHRDYPLTSSLASVLRSHRILLTNAADEIAADLMA